MDNNKIVELLREVKDPKTGQDVISLKMIEDLRIKGNDVSFAIVIDGVDQQTKSHLNFACIEKIQSTYKDAQVHVHLKSKSTTGASPKQDKSVLPQVKHIIAVASGKGGVGKSTVSANLALALSQKGHKVGMMDADLYGPSIPTMFGIQNEKPKIQQLYGKHKIIPIQKHGLHLISIGNIIEAEQAIVLRGPRLGGIIKQFIHDCIWPELDYLIIDLPPGTGDIQLSLVQTIPITGVIMVTTPQQIAYIDAVKAMNMFLLDNVNVPIIGVIENMSWFTPKELPENKYYLFGQGGGQKLADKAGVKLLGKIPLIQGIQESGDQGTPFIMKTDQELTVHFDGIANAALTEIEHRVKTKAPTTKVKMNT